MASLQIRELPEEIYEMLTWRAEKEGRSLAQQAIIELRKIPELEAREQRMAAIQRMRKRLEKQEARRVQTPPEELIREDRDR
ncbi:MAG: hypothetical protein SX243_14980 [Acidobacteriota bacterium]|nr:hypothetical protein [Acidobacteriota bacterium]